MLSTSRAFQLRHMRSPAPANDCEIPAAALFMVNLALKLQPHAVQRRRVKRVQRRRWWRSEQLLLQSTPPAGGGGTRSATAGGFGAVVDRGEGGDEFVCGHDANFASRSARRCSTHASSSETNQPTE